MGSITYDGTTVKFDDRVLAHLQIVIIRKLMKNERFLMSWKDGLSVGDGRGSIWLHPDTNLYFKFFGSKSPTINREWLLLLGRSADSSTGLLVTNDRGELIQSSEEGDHYPGTWGADDDTVAPAGP